MPDAAPAQQDSLFARYKESLGEEGAFARTLQEYVRGRPSELESLLHLMDAVFEVLAEMGLRNHQHVYLGVKRQQHNTFPVSRVWNSCHISGIVSRECVRVDDEMFVHGKYVKWLQCLWLTVHIREQEQARRAKTLVDDVPPAHVAVYREALQFVLQQLAELYEATGGVVADAKKQSTCTSAGVCVDK